MSSVIFLNYSVLFWVRTVRKCRLFSAAVICVTLENALEMRFPRFLGFVVMGITNYVWVVEATPRK